MMAVGRAERLRSRDVALGATLAIATGSAAAQVESGEEQTFAACATWLEDPGEYAAVGNAGHGRPGSR